MLTGLLYQMQHHPLRFGIIVIVIVLGPVLFLTGDFSPLP